MSEVTYWLIIDGPRFKWFPWLWRKIRGYETGDDYSQACETFNETSQLLSKKQLLTLAAEREGRFQTIHANYHK